MRRTLLFTLLCVLVLAPAAVADGAPRVLASGLDNPRGIDVDRFGFIYVAEAGRGGPGPCITGGEGTQQCLGQTGAVTLVALGKQQRIVRGQPSIAEQPSGAVASGPADVDGVGLGFGSFVTGLGGNPAVRDELGAGGSGLAKVYSFTPLGRVVDHGDLAAHEAANDPDKDEIGAVGLDTNPSAVLRDRRGHVVIDAGGNDLLRVGANGQISTVAVFPGRLVDAPPMLGLPPGTTIPMQSVPTAVAKGPDGAWYVAELTGFPFPVGGARIYRVVPGSSPQVYASGLTNVTDLAFDRDGSLYAVQFARNGILSGDPSGDVIKIAPDGTRTSLASEGLAEPYGVAIGRHGQVYVTTKSTRAGEGEVLRLR